MGTNMIWMILKFYKNNVACLNKYVENVNVFCVLLCIYIFASNKRNNLKSGTVGVMHAFLVTGNVESSHLRKILCIFCHSDLKGRKNCTRQKQSFKDLQRALAVIILK